jgi:hypothetical protein
MCFYPYSPSHVITVEFASESLTLLEKRKGLVEYYGSSDLRIDILIRNNGLRSGTGEEQIHKLYIIYPNNLFRLSEQGEERQLVTNVEVLDDSNELCSENDNNFPYHQPGTSLTYAAVSGEEDWWEVQITQPHPNTLEPRTLTGFIKGKTEITAAADIFNDLQDWRVLINNNIGLLRLDFKYPILRSECRLMRLRIKPRATSRSNHKFFSRWYNVLLTDKLFYNYEIFGPYDVQYRAGSVLKSSGYEIESTRKEEIESVRTQVQMTSDPDQAGLDKILAEINSDYTDLQERTGAIAEKLREHVGDVRCTRIMDWRLNIQAGTFKVLRNIREYGAAKICGANRNVIIRQQNGIKLATTIGDSNDKMIYQWKTGRINVCPMDAALPPACKMIIKTADDTCSQNGNLDGCYPAVGTFSIGFDCQKSYGPRIYLGYIAFVFALYRLGEWLLGLFMASH